MARIRTIKPEFWRDEALSSISAEAALLAIGLLNHCDDEGYFQANPRLIEADVFPLRETFSSTTVLIQELSDIGYIELFCGLDGKQYGLIINFSKHQVINKKTNSKIKGLHKLPDDYRSDAVGLPSGKERKGREQGSTSIDLVPSKKSRASAADAIDLPFGFSEFWQSYPNKKGKGHAIKAWSKLHPDADLLQKMLVALKAQKISDDWTRDGGKYIPHPASWLNGMRWEDELDGSAVSSAPITAAEIAKAEAKEAARRAAAAPTGPTMFETMKARKEATA